MRLALAAGLLLLAGGTAFAQAQDPAPKKTAPPPPPWQDFCCYEKGRVLRDGMVTVVYEFSHPVAEFEKLLLPYLTKEKGRIEHSEALNTFAITDTEEQIGHIEQMLKIIHVADAPVMIEARVVELRWPPRRLRPICCSSRTICNRGRAAPTSAPRKTRSPKGVAAAALGWRQAQVEPCLVLRALTSALDWLHSTVLPLGGG